MWKYRCRNQFLILFFSFLIGVVLAFDLLATNQLLPALEAVAPEIYPYLSDNIPLVYWMAGASVAMIANVFVIVSAASAVSSMLSLILVFAMILTPAYVALLSMITLPITFCVTLYGWISLHLQIKKRLAAAGIKNDDQIVQKYLEHHLLNPAYKPLALEVKRTLFKASLTSGLGLVALFCIIFLVQNFWISLVLIVFCLWAFRYISRIQANCILQITRLLMIECDPEACLSALFYLSQKGSHYRLKHRGAIAQALIYLNEPVLARDVLIQYPQPNLNNVMAYNSLMGYIDYLLKDEEGLQQCINNIRKEKVPANTMNMIVQTEEIASLENRMHLMNGDFNECKKFFLKTLHNTNLPLQKADCNYYIALISFVQGDYSLARLYFEKVVEHGNKLYFVTNAQNYLAKIEETNAPIITEDPDNKNENSSSPTLLLPFTALGISMKEEEDEDDSEDE
ncbi:MAG: hypothetical protein HDR44_01885 [Allobaculum sp.]|nr:hypothetical protein [Allobaculum sp.]